MATIHRIGSNAGDDYTTLNAWYADVKGDITNDGNAPYIAEIRGEIIMEPDGMLQIVESTTDSSHYFHIRPMTGAGVQTSIADTSNMAMVSGVMAIADAYTVVERIGMMSTQNIYPFGVGVFSDHITIDGALLDGYRSSGVYTPSVKAVYIWASGNVYSTVKNCIISDFYAEGSSINKDCFVTGIGGRDSATPSVNYPTYPWIVDFGGEQPQDHIYVYNNTMWDLRSNSSAGGSDSAVGIDFMSNSQFGDNIFVYNNVVSHINGADASGFRLGANINHSNNATEDTTLAAYLGEYNSIDPSGEFVSLASGVTQGGSHPGSIRRIDLWYAPDGDTDDEQWSMIVGTDDPEGTIGGIDLSIDTTTSTVLLGNAYNLTYNGYYNPPRIDMSGVFRSDFNGILWDIGCWALDRDSLIVPASGNYVQALVYELAQTLTDLESSASGINTYLGQKTFESYEATWDDFFFKNNNGMDELSADIDKIHQEIVLLEQGIVNHRH